MTHKFFLFTRSLGPTSDHGCSRLNENDPAVIFHWTFFSKISSFFTFLRGKFRLLWFRSGIDTLRMFPDNGPRSFIHSSLFRVIRNKSRDTRNSILLKNRTDTSAFKASFEICSVRQNRQTTSQRFSLPQFFFLIIYHDINSRWHDST